MIQSTPIATAEKKHSTVTRGTKTTLGMPGSRSVIPTQTPQQVTPAWNIIQATRDHARDRSHVMRHHDGMFSAQTREAGFVIDGVG